jgi:hypothetical protein
LLTFIFCGWIENMTKLTTEVDAVIEDGDSLCCRFCPDSLLVLDHIAAKVLTSEMDEELLIVVCELVRG